MNKQKCDYAIDLVVMWVDGSDPAWQKEFEHYCGKNESIFLYRDWDWMRYWFRGVEKNLPWIRTIHFITWGHVPSWLDTSHPKIHVVNHRDYIPEKYLPTFSSHTIELNLYRIQELSEHFIFANDDMFFVGSMYPEDYFCNGLPCDYLHIVPVTESRSKKFVHVLLNDMICLNRNFDMRACAKENWDKWFSDKYDEGMIKDNEHALTLKRFSGLSYDHMPIPLLKSTMQDVANQEEALFNTIFSRRTKSFYENVNIFLCRYWNLAKGKFVPYKRCKGAYCQVLASDEKLRQVIREENKVICLNDTDAEIDFQEKKEYILSLLEGLFPDKSGFEKD